MVAPEGRERELLTKMLTSHAYRERLASERFHAALCLAPSTDEQDYMASVVVEENEHYLGCLAVARELGIHLETLVSERMLRLPHGIPPFHTWLDALLAHTFNDKAGYFVLNGILNSKVKPYASLAASVVSDEEEHGRTGSEMLLRYYLDAPQSPNEKLRAVEAHLDAAIRCLGRPDSPGNAEALRLGLKTISSAELVRSFCSYADLVLSQIGLGDIVPLADRYLPGEPNRV